MQIGELSARTGASVRMLRYYEEHGLLEPGRTDGGYRTYAETDVLRVRHIRCMLSSALPTHVVAQALRFLLDGAPGIPESAADRATLASVLSEELLALDERIAVLSQSRAHLARFVDDIERAQVGPDQVQDIDPAAIGPAVSRGPVARRAAHPRRRIDRGEPAVGTAGRGRRQQPSV